MITAPNPHAGVERGRGGRTARRRRRLSGSSVHRRRTRARRHRPRRRAHGLRPSVNNAIIGWAADNPAALSMPFVSEIVREDLENPHHGGLDDPPGRVRRAEGDPHPRRCASRTAGPDQGRPRVRVHRRGPRQSRRRSRRAVPARKKMFRDSPGPEHRRPPVRGHRAANRLRLEQITPAADAPAEMESRFYDSPKPQKDLIDDDPG